MQTIPPLRLLTVSVLRIVWPIFSNIKYSSHPKWALDINICSPALQKRG
ncbi:unnamed protein product [Medioppia subpectinata]|uniref:Uncharacterized protein n=1 Tax=Medioppia subpectinata TaxID=1979941 RepID=A0A7R9L4S3_9ACAR|nr:unnamed protein product [Medioppia subpectinata]CAG2115273.1 unnamed protein product [Medioppia subpectinata]